MTVEDVFCFIFLDDWEVVEEKKTLSDEVIVCTHTTRIGPGSRVIPEEYVKEALKELYDYINSGKWSMDNEGSMCGNLLNKIKEKFGEEMLK